jgi:inorganic pyrophosphatase
MPLAGALICEQVQNGKSIRNDRFLFVPIHSQQFSHVETLGDINPTTLNEVEAFFTQYNRLEGKEFTVLKHLMDDEAFQCIKDSYG